MVGAIAGDLFGESVGLYNGSSEFSVVDIDLPGNNSLPVRLGRRLKIEPRDFAESIGGFGAWDVDIPYIYGVFDARYKWNQAGNQAAARCSQLWIPKTDPGARLDEVWSGNHMYLPGVGEQEVMDLIPGSQKTGNESSYRWTTRDNHKVTCKSSTSNGYPGEGFIVVAPNGVRYTFDVGVERKAPDMDGGMAYYVGRVKVLFLASRVEDVSGNLVSYSYSSGRITSIASSDGRRIELEYSGKEIVRARANDRVWTYQYLYPTHSQALSNMREAMLTRIINPDGSSWDFQYKGSLRVGSYSGGAINVGCPEPYMSGTSGLSMAISHPSGALGEFEFLYTRHYRSGVPETCMPLDPNWHDNQNEPGEGGRSHALSIPDFFDLYSLISKRISGAGLSPMQWNYAYEQTAYGRTMGMVPCASCAGQKSVVIGNPDGTKDEHIFGVRYHDNDGVLLGTRKRAVGGSVMRETAHVYVSEAEQASMPFPKFYGGTFIGGVDPSSIRIRPVKLTRTIQDGVSFVLQVNSFDAFARPLSVTRSSNVSGAPSRTEVSQYHDNLSRWVLGQQAKLTVNGVVAEETAYDSLARPTSNKAFGKLQQTLTYNADGTVASVKDGNNNVTTLSSWYRGVPRTITYADSTATSAVVNDSGWIMRVTDENGFATNYGYDAMGRLGSIAYPTSDTTAWNSTTQAFAQINASEFGIAAGHWRQTVTTGNGVKVSYLDALWRPLLVHEYDAGNVAGTQRFQRFAYDHAGRATFTSYPRASDALTTGVWTIYDALGRSTSISQDSEHGLLTTTTAYLPGFQTMVTNPNGAKTQTIYQVFDQPTYDYPAGVSEYGGNRHTEIYRDSFGKVTALRRRNGSGSESAWRRYVYDANQLLCKAIEPETGATVMAYDGAGNLAWSAAGQHNLASAANCNTAEGYGSGRRVDRTYDTRNRLKTMAFPDSNGNQAWNYTADGLPSSVVTFNSEGGSQVVNSYVYNKRRLLTQETQNQPNELTSTLSYAYNVNGHPSGITYPSGALIDYAPNALGQPTRAGTYATGVGYFPNGGLKQFTYGNGITHTLTQNARGLPAQSCDVYGACSAAAVLNDTYTYDVNGNVTKIVDGRTGGRATRTMTYDGLDRLKTVSSTMFGNAAYSHDVLDNLTRATVGATANLAARDHYYCYDAKWQLTNVKTGGCSSTSVVGLAYDVQGNLANRNGYLHTFDYGNRLRLVTYGGAWVEAYRYDVHGRRVRSNNGTMLRSVYSNAGELLHQRNDRTSKATDYVMLNGSLVASVDRPLAGGTATVTYQHTDALGSPVAVTNVSRVVTETSEYEPFGRVGNRAVRDGVGYTGHAEDAATGLTYMQQRYYDPMIGRFLSVDPVTAYSNPIGAFNRYWYANNNPYKFTDPDGRDSFLVSRPLDNAALSCCASHNFVVSNADYVGDPKATVHSFGKTNNGNTGRVDSSTKGMSEGTANKDQSFWKGLEKNAESAKTNATQIKASDAAVDRAANGVLENTQYSLTPTGGKTNSNSAASAVANRAQGSAVAVPGGARISPGSGQAEKIKFKEDQRKK